MVRPPANSNHPERPYRQVVATITDRYSLAPAVAAALSGILFLLSTIFFVDTAPTFDLGVLGASTAGGSTALVAFLVCGAGYLVAARIAWVWVGGLVGLALCLIGFAHAFAVTALAAVVGAPEAAHAGTFVVQFVQPVVWGLIVMTVAHRFRQQASTTARLIAAEQSLREQKAAADVAIQTHTQRLQELVDVGVVPEVDVLLTHLRQFEDDPQSISADQLSAMGEQLNDVSARLVRPLSHQLAGPSAPVTTPATVGMTTPTDTAPGFLATARASATHAWEGLARPLSVSWVASIAWLIVGVRVVANVPTGAAILVALVVGGVIWLSLWSIERVLSTAHLSMSPTPLRLTRWGASVLIGALAAWVDITAYWLMESSSGPDWIPVAALSGSAIAVALVAGIARIPFAALRRASGVLTLVLVAAVGAGSWIIYAGRGAGFGAVVNGVIFGLVTLLVALGTDLSRSRAIDSRTVARTVRQQRDAVEQALETEHDLSVTLSRTLHGDVQGTLTGAALGMALAADGRMPTREAVEAAIGAIEAVAADLRSATLRPEQRYEPASLASGPPDDILGNAIDRLSERWPALDIQTSIAPRAREALQGRGDLVNDVVDIASEAITNAVRHGSATRVAVGVAVSGRPDGTQVVDMTIDDDGAGLTGASRELHLTGRETWLGLGMLSVLDSGAQVALGASPAGGARLRARWPIDDSPSPAGNDSS